MAERDIVRNVLNALALRRVFAWRANSGTLVLEHNNAARRVIRGAPAGTPDIIGILPGGRFFGLEVKTATGALRASQSRWAERATSIGARWAVVRSVGDALEAIESWTNEERAAH